MLTLAGCQSSEPDTLFTHYLNTLEKALPGATGAAVTGTVSAHAGIGVAPVDTGEYETVDILDVRGCNLQRTVIREQSRLGKTAKPSQRLLLTLEYLRLAPDCVQHLRQRDDGAIADTLERTWERRRHELPTHIFNATLDSSEYRAFWAVDRAPMGYPRVAQSTTVAALAAIEQQASRWLEGDFTAHNLEFELVLGEVAGGAGGAVLHSLHSRTEGLAGANHRLLHQLQRDPACQALTNRRESARLMAAARRVFYAHVLPDITASLQRMTVLLAPVAALEARLGHVLPGAYQRWRTMRDSRVAAARTAPARHLVLLARVERACAPA